MAMKNMTEQISINPSFGDRRPAYVTLHKNVLASPLLFLSEDDRKSCLPVKFSNERGKIHVVTPTGHMFEEGQSLYVVANGGAQLMNSDHYFQRHENERSRKIIEKNEQAVSPTMLAFSMPQDVLILNSSNPDLQRRVLDQLSASWKRIGINTTTNYQFVSSVDDWLSDKMGRVPIVPNVISPEIVLGFGGTENEAFSYVAAYTKDGIQLLWDKNGVPTPKTFYFNVGQDIPTDLQAQRSNYEEWVVSRTDGSGGFGISYIPDQNLIDFLGNLTGENKYQIQGKLPLVFSPCLIANISPDKSQPLFVSVQRFSKPGVHLGNIWYQGLEKRLNSLADDFFRTNYQSLESLRQAGIQGQINVDSIVMNRSNAMKNNLPTTTMREANIRPAGSSVMLRIVQGNINEQTVKSIRTITGIHIPSEMVLNGQILNFFSSYDTENMRAHLYNYNLEQQKANIAFVSSSSNFKKLRQFEIKVMRDLTINQS